MVDKLHSIDSVTFLESYVRNRKPLILTSLPADLSCLNIYSDLEYLSSVAGETDISVEPISKQGTFGTGATRSQMKFSELLVRLNAGESLYLTTQYTKGAENILEEPLISLCPPLTTDMTKDMVLAKMNIWLGSGQKDQKGSSSGLHHDFHDNVYVLLSGRKKFRIFPPSREACKKIRTNGSPTCIYDNGLIAYDDDLGSDGLTQLRRAEIKVAAREHKIAQLKKSVASEGQLADAEALLDEAIDTFMELQMTGDVDSLQDDFESEPAEVSLSDEDALEDRDSTNLSDTNLLSSQSVDEDEDTGEDEERCSRDSEDQADDSDSDEPASFSSLPHADYPALLQYKSLQGQEFWLEAGQLLWLPASYFHEVISYPGGDKEKIHIAVNYWFYPVDGPSETAIYRDEEIMQELRRQNATLQQELEMRKQASRQNSDKDTNQPKRRRL